MSAQTHQTTHHVTFVKMAVNSSKVLDVLSRKRWLVRQRRVITSCSRATCHAIVLGIMLPAHCSLQVHGSTSIGSNRVCCVSKNTITNASKNLVTCHGLSVLPYLQLRAPLRSLSSRAPGILLTRLLLFSSFCLRSCAGSHATNVTNPCVKFIQKGKDSLYGDQTHGRVVVDGGSGRRGSTTTTRRRRRQR